MSMHLDRVTILAGLAGVLLVACLVVQITWVESQLDRVRSLEAQQADQARQLESARIQRAETVELARMLKVPDVGSLLDAESEEPVRFIGRMLSETKLTRLELTALESKESMRLRRSSFSLRLLGSYAEVVKFMNAIEASPRLVVVDAFEVERSDVSRELECRLNLSIFDPKNTVTS